MALPKELGSLPEYGERLRDAGESCWVRLHSEEEILDQAKRSAEATHNHPEGIKGAQATALAIYRARTSASKEAIREEVGRRFHYDLSRTVEEIRPAYGFDETGPGTVPEAIISFLDSTSYEDAIRNAISLGARAATPWPAHKSNCGGVLPGYLGGDHPRVRCRDCPHRYCRF